MGEKEKLVSDFSDVTKNAKVEKSGDTLYIRWTFCAAMHQTSVFNKEKYSSLKNMLLSYRTSDKKRLRNTEYRRYSVFYAGKEIVAKVTIRQRLLKVFLLSTDGSGEWIEYKIRSQKAFREVCDHVQLYAELHSWTKRPRFNPIDYVEKFPELSNVILVKRWKKGMIEEDDGSLDNEEEEESNVYSEKEEGKVVIEALGLCSCEHNESKDRTLKPLLGNINISIHEGDIVGVSGENTTSVVLLCEILGNMRNYYKGFLRVGSIGSKQDKGSVLDHTFFIDGDGMLYDQMTVLEQLLFTAYNRSKQIDGATRQKEMLDLLVDYGLRDVSLKKNSELSKGQRMLVCITVAAVSESPIIIANLTDCTFTQPEAEVFAALSDLLREKGKTVVIGTMQPKIIGMACDEAIYIAKGEVEFAGTVDELVRTWDKVVCFIKGKDIEKWSQIISDDMPGYKCIIEDGNLFIRNHTDSAFDVSMLYTVLARNNIIPDFIKFNKGRAQNAFEELSGRL